MINRFSHFLKFLSKASARQATSEVEAHTLVLSIVSLTVKFIGLEYHVESVL
jgi:hypothetical protein